MKKITCLLIVSAYLFNGCHSKTTSNNSVNAAITTDTARRHTVVTPQSADTSIKDGPLIKKYPNGVVKERSYYVAGRREGECQSFYPSGKLWSDDFFTAGLLDGATTSYYENGQKRYEGTCIKGKPSGIWHYYDTGGKLVRMVDFNKKQGNQAM